jgi:hypothetical protein
MFGNAPFCDGVGSCSAAPGTTGITNCIHCGKELHQRGDQWFTWDAPADGGRPQDYVRDAAGYCVHSGYTQP